MAACNSYFGGLKAADSQKISRISFLVLNYVQTKSITTFKHFANIQQHNIFKATLESVFLSIYNFKQYLEMIRYYLLINNT